MEKIVIKKANAVENRDELTTVRIDKAIYDRMKNISEETGYSIRYIVDLLLTEAEKLVEIVE